MSGEGGIQYIRAKLAALQAVIDGTNLEDGDGIEIVGDEIRLDIANLPTAPEN